MIEYSISNKSLKVETDSEGVTKVFVNGQALETVEEVYALNLEIADHLSHKSRIIARLTELFSEETESATVFMSQSYEAFSDQLLESYKG